MTSSNTTPRKKKLQRIILNKECIIKQQRLKIRKIQAQNRRLKKRIHKMQDILNNIQQKFSMQDEDISVLKNINVKVCIILHAAIYENQHRSLYHPFLSYRSPLLYENSESKEYTYNFIHR